MNFSGGVVDVVVVVVVSSLLLFSVLTSLSLSSSGFVGIQESHSRRMPSFIVGKEVMCCSGADVVDVGRSVDVVGETYQQKYY